MSDNEAAHALAKAYRGAFEAATGKPCWSARLPQVVRSKAWRLLLAAGALLRDAGVPPAGWVAWSFDVWKGIGRSKDPPAIGWTFAAKRINEGLEWYTHEGYDFLGGTIVSGPIEKDFVHRFAALQAAAWREPDGAALLARFFPSGYAQALKAVEREIEQGRARLEQRLADGEWLWG